MKLISYVKLLKENKQLKEENLNLYRANNDLLETMQEYKTRNLKQQKTIKELKERLKEVQRWLMTKEDCKQSNYKMN